MKKPKRKYEEYQIQTAFMEWLQLYDESLYHSTFHVPNGGLRNVKTATFLRKMGAKSGVPDLFCAISSHGYHGLFIEIKSKEGKYSSKQLDFMERLTENGYHVAICNSLDKLIELIKWYDQGRKYVQRKSI